MKGAYAGNEREANDHSGRISPSPPKGRTISVFKYTPVYLKLK